MLKKTKNEMRLYLLQIIMTSHREKERELKADECYALEIEVLR